MKPTNGKLVVALTALTLIAATQTSLAMYDPSLQRWISRDPIGHKGGRNLYSFVMSNPVSVVDPKGLLPSSSVGCEDPCGDAKKMGADQGQAGGVICCGGQKYACSWNPTENGKITNPKAVDIVEKCQKAHEKQHFDQTQDCSSSCFPYQPKKRPDVKRADAECDAFQAEQQCFRDSISDCAGDPDCLNQVAWEMGAVDAGLHIYCKGLR